MTQLDFTPEMRLSVDRCKSLLLAWPGAIFYLPERQIGKTVALLEVVFEQHQSRALIVAMSRDQAKYIEQAYETLYPARREKRIKSKSPMTSPSPPWPEPMFQSFSEREDVSRYFQGLANQRQCWPIFVDEPDHYAPGVLEELCDCAYYFNTTVTGIGQAIEQRSWHTRHRERQIAAKVLAANQR